MVSSACKGGPTHDWVLQLIVRMMFVFPSLRTSNGDCELCSCTFGVASSLLHSVAVRFRHVHMRTCYRVQSHHVPTATDKNNRNGPPGNIKACGTNNTQSNQCSSSIPGVNDTRIKCDHKRIGELLEAVAVQYADVRIKNVDKDITSTSKKGANQF